MKRHSILLKFLFLICNASLIFAMENHSAAVELSPPQYILQNQFRAAFDARHGADPCLWVAPLKMTSPSSYALSVHVICGGPEKAKALSTLLTKTHQFSGIRVDVTVIDNDNTVVVPDRFPSNTDLAQILITNALSQNSYFATLHDGNGVYEFFVVFTKSVIQYPSDNGADAFGNTNIVAALLFYQILGFHELNPIMRIGTSTEKLPNAELNLRLSPPWTVLRAQMNATIGADPCVEVKNLVQISDAEYLLPVYETCGSGAKGKALATLLTKSPHRFGQVVVKVLVIGNDKEVIPPAIFPKNADAAMNFLLDALTGNPYFVKFDQGNWIYQFFIEFNKAVIQYQADNIADAFRNINQTPAAAFFNILRLANLQETIMIGTSTEVIYSF